MAKTRESAGGYAEAVVRKVAPVEIPKVGKAIRITALGAPKRLFQNEAFPKGKEFTNQGVFITPGSEGWNKSVVEALKKDPGLTVEHFEDGEQVLDRDAHKNFVG